jgi:serine/threonine protein kinase
MAIKRARDSGGGIDVNLALRQEEKALRQAAGSGVVKVHEFQEEDPYHYLVLDYCDGKTLEDLLAARSAPLSREMSLALIMQAACILQHVHHEGVYRIDLKPGNIAFHNQEMIFIDFGTALIEGDEESLEWKALAMGTPDYAAPELMSNPESVDERVDLYALGAIFYELLTGNPPTAEGPQLTLLPDDIAPVVQQLLAPSLEERYDSAVELLSHLPGADAMALSTVYDMLVNDMQETQVRRGQRTEIVLEDVVSIKRDTQPVRRRRMRKRTLTGSRAGKSRAVTEPFFDCKTPFLESIHDGIVHSLSSNRILIGRLNTCDVIIDDPSVSRIHALLQRSERSYQLVDLHSYNGVMVNGTRVQAEHLLQDGERLNIGPKEFIYTVPD